MRRDEAGVLVTRGADLDLRLLFSRGAAVVTPYYQDSAVTIYHGDCRDVLPSLDVKLCITDPVWPNAHPDLVGAEDPSGLFADALACMPAVERLCIWLGCQSDPRFLLAVPSRLPFLRTCHLRRAVPSYNGRCLVSGDVLYAFGSWPAPRPGHIVVPGECTATSILRNKQPHVCARNEKHADWVIDRWSEPGSTIVDPFCGSGTLLLSAKNNNRKAIGVETTEEHCETAARRMTQEVLALEALP